MIGTLRPHSTMALMLALAGCGAGSGGGGVATTPAPPVATPTNTTITDLQATQSFVNDAATVDVTFDTASQTTITARTANAPLTVRYDATNRSYAVSGGIAEVFNESDRQSTGNAGETRYFRRSDGGTTYLTLVTTSYRGNTSNSYVGMGYLQQNAVANGRQQTRFTTFAYGLDTPASAMQRTGTGSFVTDVFGLESLPGIEPNVFQGQGRFDVDFLNGQFATFTSVTRTGLISGKSLVGGGNYLTAGGRLSAADGTFTGDTVYSSGDRYIGGTFAGRFFGPTAQEIGASFSGSASDGAAFNGTLTGQRNPAASPFNLSFARIATLQDFSANETSLTIRTPRNGGVPYIIDSPGTQIGRAASVAKLYDRTGGIITFAAPSSNLASGDYSPGDIVGDDGIFTRYARVIGGQPTRLDLYKTGSANRELALTYASMGHYSTTIDSDPVQRQFTQVFFTYGFNSPGGLFANRTGSASYAGVAYGAGVEADGRLLDVKGTTQFRVDFGTSSLSGDLALRGTAEGRTVEYGTFDFSGKVFTSSGTADIRRGSGGTIGSMLVDFYGRSAEEAGAIFRIDIPDGAGAKTLINGALLAKRQ